MEKEKVSYGQCTEMGITQLEEDVRKDPSVIFSCLC